MHRASRPYGQCGSHVAINCGQFLPSPYPKALHQSRLRIPWQGAVCRPSAGSRWFCSHSPPLPPVGCGKGLVVTVGNPTDPHWTYPPVSSNMAGKSANQMEVLVGKSMENHLYHQYIIYYCDENWRSTEATCLSIPSKGSLQKGHGTLLIRPPLHWSGEGHECASRTFPLTSWLISLMNQSLNS